MDDALEHLVLAGGIGAAADHAHLFAAEEEGVADGAVAHAPAVKGVDAVDGGRIALRAAGDDCGARIQRARGSLHGKALFAVFDPEQFAAHHAHAQLFRLAHARFDELPARNAVFKAVIVLYQPRPRQRARAVCDDGDVRPAAHGVQRRRNARRTLPDDDKLLHVSAPDGNLYVWKVAFDAPARSADLLGSRSAPRTVRFFTSALGFCLTAALGRPAQSLFECLTSALSRPAGIPFWALPPASFPCTHRSGR